MKKLNSSFLALGLLTVALPAQQDSRDLAAGLGAQSLYIDLDAATGEVGSLGITHLNGEIFTSTRISPAVGGLHFVSVFDGSGSKLRSWFQPGFAQASEWGFRDGASDGGNLFFGFDFGIEIVDVNGTLLDGLTGPNISPANGPVTILGGLISGNVLKPENAGINRALAFDRQGNGGDGSFWTGNFGSSIFETDISGDVISSYPNAGEVSYGFGLDPVSRATPNSPATRMWLNSAPDSAGILGLGEFDMVAGTLTGVSMSSVAGIQGGLDIVPATLGRGPSASGYDVLHLQQGGPDAARIRRLHLDVAGQGMPPSPVTRLGTEEPDLLNTIDNGQIWPLNDRGQVDYDMRNKSLEMVWDLSRNPGDGAGNGGLNGTAAVIFVNIGPDADPGHDATSNLLGIRELAHLQPILTVPQPLFLVRSRGMVLSNDPLQPRSDWVVNLVPGMPFQAIGECIRAQGLWLDGDVAFLPVALSNQTRFCRVPDGLLPSATYGVMLGNNSFNADTSSGFWQLINDQTDPDLSIVRLSLTIDPTNPNLSTSTQSLLDSFFRWDTDNGDMADVFEGGNSLVAGCQGTYRNGSEVSSGLIFAGTPPSPCDPGALLGWDGADDGPTIYGSAMGDYLTLTFEFAPDTFLNGAKFEFDCDTDGGIGVNGGAMRGVIWEVEFKNGSVSSGEAVADTTVPFRSFAVL